MHIFFGTFFILGFVRDENVFLEEDLLGVRSDIGNLWLT
jgi:hypothetical protein